MMNQRCGLVTFHGPMVSSNMLEHWDAETEASLQQALAAEGWYEFRNPEGKEITVLRGAGESGILEGRLAGGNLCLACASLGTPYEIDTDGTILFLEDVHEDVGNMERYFMQLKLSGKLAGCKCVLLGQYTDVKNEKDPEYTPEVCFRDLTEDLGIPVLANIQSGHDFPMMTLPLGADCRVDAASGRIWFRGR